MPVMKKRLLILIVTLASLSLGIGTVSGQGLFLWGNVKWATGSPSVGVEVKLIHRNWTVRSVAYTDQSGSYAFFGIEGRPSDHMLMVYSKGSLLGQQRVRAVQPGSQVPDIRLSNKILRTYAVPTPQTVAPGQKTTITVTVRDENGQPVKNVKTTISAGGGKFLRTGESYNPQSRLHGPYSVIGFTDARGRYQTSWVCNPCARGYGLRVESAKDGYIMSAFDLMVNVRE